jgi:hypothetical protein
MGIMRMQGCVYMCVRPHISVHTATLCVRMRARACVQRCSHGIADRAALNLDAHSGANAEAHRRAHGATVGVAE